MSRREERDRDRDRGDRSSRSQQQAAARTNEYFVPKEGIDREVITADICRYLGNDALVRPGTYENPQTRLAQLGYFITAYRNLTTAMIADLKADSERWDAERRQTASRGQQPNGSSSRDEYGMVRKSDTPAVEYRSSQVHQSRQYYGPTEQPPPVQGGYPAQAGYAAATTSVQQQQQYDTTPYQQSNTYTSQPAQGYATTAQGYAPESYYVAGANLTVDQQQRTADRSGIPQAGAGAVPRAVQYSSTPNTYQQADTRGGYYSSAAAPISSTQAYNTTPADPFYGRAAPVAGAYDTSAPEYDRGVYADSRPQTYPDTAVYSQPPATTPTTTTSSGSSRRDRERDDRDSRRHHSRR